MIAPSPDNTYIIIPARMQSQRLPGKPLADISGVPMIVRVWQRAMAAKAGRVLVAAAEDQIVKVIRQAGGDAIATDPALASGSDRIAEALRLRQIGAQGRFVVNLQGDLPSIPPDFITRCLAPLARPENDISTLAAMIHDPAEIADPSVVKAVADLGGGSTMAVARDFQRRVQDPSHTPFWHHIGIYAFQRQALDRFVSLARSAREIERNLEQMRALDDGMRIVVSRVDSVPPGVDTPADLEKIRAHFRTGQP